MKGFVHDIEGLAVDDANFRRVVYTAKNSQLVEAFKKAFGHLAT